MSIYLIEGRQKGNSSQICEFHRNNDGTCEMKQIDTFKPYFFCDEDARVEQLEGVLRTEHGFKSIERTPLKKVYMQKSTLIKGCRGMVRKMGFKDYEGDVLFHNRYTIDLKEDIEEGPLKVCWIDIECAPEDTFLPNKNLEEQKFPDIEQADQSICCLTTKIGDNMQTWLWGPTKVEGIRNFNNEEDMLNDFMTYFFEESPDIISAWNLKNFDLKYIINRCERLNIDVSRFSKTRDVWARTIKGEKSHKTVGTVQLDLLDGYKLWRKYGNMPLLASYSLDFVAETVLGKNKLDHGKSMAYLWKNDVKTLIEYNKWDVELLDLIDKQCKVIDFFDNIRRKCHIQFEDVYKTTAMIDGFLMNRLNKKIILPSAKYREGEKFEGAFVFDPVPGLYNNILCLDIAAMYPSIIKNFNISYETVGGGEIILPLESPISFSTLPGIIPMFMDELAVERKKYKKLRDKYDKTDPKWRLYDQRQYGTKIIMNSFFGYLGYPGSRLYKKVVASSITGMGKHIILKIAEWCEEYGNKVIYGDTDSVYIVSTKDGDINSVEEGMDVADYIDVKLKEFALNISGKNYLHIEFEKALKIVLFTDAKKRYAYKLLWEDGKRFKVDDKIHVSGFDSKRSDSNVVSKIAQRTVIEMLLDGKKKSEVVNMLRDLNTKMKKGGFTHADIGVPKGIKKELTEYWPPPAVVKGAYYSNLKFNTNFGKNSKPKFTYVKDYCGEVPEFTMECSKGTKTYKVESIAYDNEIPQGFTIDWEKITNNTFKKKLIKIFQAVDWDWEDLGVVGLDKWM